MALLEHIRSDRVQKRKKQPIRRSLFAVVYAIISEYGLGAGFLENLGALPDLGLMDSLGSGKVRVKETLDIPIFPLAGEDEYRLAREIMSSVENPYLLYARSPDEILLSTPLYDRNPSLRPEMLERFHFDALLRCELARDELQALSKEAYQLERRLSDPDSIGNTAMEYLARRMGFDPGDGPLVYMTGLAERVQAGCRARVTVAGGALCATPSDLAGWHGISMGMSLAILEGDYSRLREVCMEEFVKLERSKLESVRARMDGLRSFVSIFDHTWRRR